MISNQCKGSRPGRLLGATAVLSALLFLWAIPSDAATCDYATYRSTFQDYAATFEENQCTQSSVRHRYDPVWSSNNYWTPWAYGADYAATSPTAELFDSQHAGS